MKKDIKNTLCNTHNDIIFNLQNIKKELKKQKIDLSVLDNITYCVEMCRRCKKMGQRMENRLKLYKNSIEDLGFKRIGE